MRKTLNPNEIPPDKREWLTDGRDYKLSFDQGACEVRIIGEGGKVNINLVSETMLRKIATNVGVKIEARDTVVDSILDWRDPDDLYRVNGAENDYYRSLKEPYDCKNGPLDAIEELLLVKGVTPDLFYGKKLGETGEGEAKVDPVGLKDIFSIYATGEQIDINSAPLPALKVVLGIPEEIARLIVRAREEKPHAPVLHPRPHRSPSSCLFPAFEPRQPGDPGLGGAPKRIGRCSRPWVRRPETTRRRSRAGARAGPARAHARVRRAARSE